VNKKYPNASPDKSFDTSEIRRSLHAPIKELMNDEFNPYEDSDDASPTVRERKKKLKKLKQKVEETPKNFLVAAATGNAIPLSEVPDQVFAQKLAGDGMAIMVTGDTIVAPADGELSLVFKTKHAFAMTLENGLEILVHIGVDTVSLDGQGFEQLAEQGTKVKAGTPIIKIDREFILSKGLSLATPVLITNVDAAKSITPVESGSVVAGETAVVNFEV
jgi:PTS system D-glucosamine-specific IIA component/PTS system glucose-specific IIA component